MLLEAFPEARIATEVVPDETTAIVAAFQRHRQADFILTTGGTGVSSRDVTPEATRGYCQRELPGIAEVLRAESYNETPTAVLSRGVAGIKGNTIIVNFPGSVKAVRLCTRVLIPVMEHALSMLHGGDH
jgi:molybdenum cofactor synthesis domain-containing protein